MLMILNNFPVFPGLNVTAFPGRFLSHQLPKLCSMAGFGSQCNWAPVPSLEIT